MAGIMQMDVLSPDAYVLQTDEVSYIEVQTTDGGLGIFPGHATMVAALAPSAAERSTSMALCSSSCALRAL